MATKSIQGPIGLRGPSGPRGLTGARGPSGSRGPQGIQGPSNGIVGPKGDTGEAGRSITVHIQQRAPNNSEGIAGDIWYQY